VLCAARSDVWWPLSGGLGLAAVAWLVRCTWRRDVAWLSAGIGGLAVAYAVSLVAAVNAVDAWAAVYAALLLLVTESAHAAAGAPDQGFADPATRGRYALAAGVAVLAGFGVAALMLAAAGSGGAGGAEVTALGAASAAAALALLAATARRAAAP